MSGWKEVIHLKSLINLPVTYFLSTKYIWINFSRPPPMHFYLFIIYYLPCFKRDIKWQAHRFISTFFCGFFLGGAVFFFCLPNSFCSMFPLVLSIFFFLTMRRWVLYLSDWRLNIWVDKSVMLTLAQFQEANLAKMKLTKESVKVRCGFLQANACRELWTSSVSSRGSRDPAEEGRPPRQVGRSKKCWGRALRRG